MAEPEVVEMLTSGAPSEKIRQTTLPLQWYKTGKSHISLHVVEYLIKLLVNSLRPSDAYMRR